MWITQTSLSDKAENTVPKRNNDKYREGHAVTLSCNGKLMCRVGIQCI